MGYFTFSGDLQYWKYYLMGECHEIREKERNFIKVHFFQKAIYRLHCFLQSHYCCCYSELVVYHAGWVGQLLQDKLFKGKTSQFYDKEHVTFSPWILVLEPWWTAGRESSVPGLAVWSPSATSHQPYRLYSTLSMESISNQPSTLQVIEYIE